MWDRTPKSIGRAGPARRSAAIRTVVIVAATLWLAAIGPAAAQVHVPGVPQSAEPARSVNLDDLKPEGVDRLLSGLTDEEIRVILREELLKDAEARVAADAERMNSISAFEERIDEMAMTIVDRAERWAEAIANLDQRVEDVRMRLETAKNGVWGMVLAAAIVLFAGVASALAVIWATARIRRRVSGSPEVVRTYWDRLVRTVGLTVLDLLPVFAFVGVTRVVAKFVLASLGPLEAYVWIYHAGVSGGWALIVISRRIFAPDAPAVRIAPLSDDSVAEFHRRFREAVQIGVGGWLIAGLSPALGFGLPPAMIIVALSGTVVALIMIGGILQNRGRITEACEEFLSPSGEPLAGPRRLLADAAPAIIIAYLGFAYLYWVLLWLEQGQQRLYGPVGTIFVLMTVPALDQIGRELARILSGQSERAQRYTEVLHGAWRVILVIAVLAAISRLWGAPLHQLVLGPDAVLWVKILWNILLTLLLAQLVWKLILVTFETPREEAHEGDMEDGGAGEASRLGTLIPLVRTVLLGVVIAVTLMTVLAAMGLDIGPLLASAGILGIAVGFGAQTLVRDIFSGMFFLIDDAFRVGEYIETDNGLRGEVEAISIRSLQLRNHKGPVVTVPFGELKAITNHNRDWVIYKMNFRLEPDTDPAKVKKVVKALGKELLENPVFGQNFIEPLKSQGVYMIDEDSALVIRVKFKCKPRTQFVLRREVYHAIKRAFAENDIHFARRKVEVVAVGEDGHEVPVSKDLAAQAASAIAEKEQDAQPAPADDR